MMDNQAATTSTQQSRDQALAFVGYWAQNEHVVLDTATAKPSGRFPNTLLRVVVVTYAIQDNSKAYIGIVDAIFFRIRMFSLTP
jgi:hypothetical protein